MGSSGVRGPYPRFPLALANHWVRIIVERCGRDRSNDGPLMVQSLRIPGILGVALAALAGTVLSANDASACSPKKAGIAAPKCCAGARASSCGCCGRVSTSSEHGLASQSGRRAELRLILSLPESRPCDCRPTEPAPASSKHESRPTEGRPTEACLDAPLPGVTRPTLTLVSESFHVGSPPHLPLYLRTARLLI
jgi:hypothetical protein